MNRALGFTLVEVLVALLILAIALAGAISTMSQQGNGADALKRKTLALWVAHNRLAEIQLQGEWPDLGKSSGEAEMAGVEWRWSAEVTRTEDDRLRRIDIEILDPDEPDRRIAELDGFLAQK